MDRPDLLIPTRGGEEELAIEWSSLSDSATALDLYGFLQSESVPTRYLILLLEELWRIKSHRTTFSILNLALQDRRHPTEDQLPLLCMKANYLLAMSRKAPKFILERPRGGRRLGRTVDNEHPERDTVKEGERPRTKDDYWSEVDQTLSLAASISPSDKRVLDLRSILSLARGQHEPSLKQLEAILQQEPTNTMALMAKARILFARRAFRPALKIYQLVLSLVPMGLPDPRVGIGLCLWMLGDKDKARRAWERSIAVHPSNPTISALLLLALSHLHTSRDQSIPGSFEQAETLRIDAYAKGVKLLQEAFKKDNTAAAAAGPLASHFLTVKQWDSATKLAERAIQFADARALLAEGHLIQARILHAQGDYTSAVTEYRQSITVNPEQLVAGLAWGQSLVKDGDIPAATNHFSNILRRHPRCIEALVSLASIHTHLAFSHKLLSDAQSEKRKAKEMYETVFRIFNSSETGSGSGKEKSGRIRAAEQDEGLWIEVAKLWDTETELKQTGRAYKIAIRLQESRLLDSLLPSQPLDPTTNEPILPPISERPTAQPELINNLAIVAFNRGDFENARKGFEEAGAKAGEAENHEAVLMATSYNLGCVYESLGEKERAKEAWELVVKRHGEFVDAKARLALLALSAKDFELSHNLIKESLTSQPSNPELRSLYTYFLYRTSSIKIACDFTIDSLRLHKDKFPSHNPDIYALCAAGTLYYHLARESREMSKDAQKERARNYGRAGEYFDKVLKMDNQCGFAAMGLGIAVAEGALGSGEAASLGGGVQADQVVKGRNARDAMGVFMKLKEGAGAGDGSVFVNIGHCCFLREEWGKAIENYASASKRFGGKDLDTLLYLARAYYHKANHDHSFGDIKLSLDAARSALAISPNDRAITFNVAMILQKGVEILTGLSPERRNLDQLNEAIQNCEESLELFQNLIDEKIEHPPYHPDLPKHRQAYGRGLLKKAPDLIASQTTYEASESLRRAEAKKLRDLERAKLQELEDERLEKLRRQNEELARQRRAINAETEAWTKGALARDEMEDEEEDGKKKSRKRGKKVGGKKEDGAESSGEEDEKPKVKRKKSNKKDKEKEKEEKSQMDVDGDESDEPVKAPKRKTGRGGKQFKSTEFIDSDDSDSDAVGGGNARREEPEPEDDAGATPNSASEDD